MIAADFRVCLDACVMANHGVCDLLLKLAEKPRMYTPVFSQAILEEVHGVHVDHLSWPSTLADSFEKAVKRAFPEALTEGFEQWIPKLTNDPKDRHVLAAAVQGKAELIVTFNLKHFRAEDLTPWGISARHPQEYLITLFEFKPEIVVSKLYEIAKKRNQTAQESLAKLGKSIPRFTEHVADSMAWDLDDIL